MIADCKTQQDFRQLVQNSEKRPVFLLKHSTRCPISGSAWRAFQQFDAKQPEAELWRVLVVENATLSSAIAQEVEVRHQSPQVLLLHRGKVVWNDSHWSIKVDALQDALDELLAD